MPIRNFIASAVAALLLANGGNAAPNDPGWIEVLSYSHGSTQSSADDRSITIHGHRTEDVGATPADRDGQLKGQKILQNAPVDPKAAIAVNTPLRTLPSRSPGGGEIVIESFSWGSTTVGKPSASQTSLRDSPVDPSGARRSRVTTLSFDVGAPRSDSIVSPIKHEDIAIGVGAGMDAGRAPAAQDWAKAQEIHASKDFAAKPGTMLLPAMQKVREAAARMSSEQYLEIKMENVFISSYQTGAAGGAKPPVQVEAGQLSTLGAPQRLPTIKDGTSSTIMIGERMQRLAPAAPAVRR